MAYLLALTLLQNHFAFRLILNLFNKFLPLFFAYLFLPSELQVLQLTISDFTSLLKIS